MRPDRTVAINIACDARHAEIVRRGIVATSSLSAAAVIRAAIAWRFEVDMGERLEGIRERKSPRPFDPTARRLTLAVPVEWAAAIERASAGEYMAHWVRVALGRWGASLWPDLAGDESRRTLMPTIRVAPVRTRPMRAREVEFLAQCRAGSVWPAGREPASVRAMR